MVEVSPELPNTHWVRNASHREFTDQEEVPSQVALRAVDDEWAHLFVTRPRSLSRVEASQGVALQAEAQLLSLRA